MNVNEDVSPRKMKKRSHIPLFPDAGEGLAELINLAARASCAQHARPERLAVWT